MVILVSGATGTQGGAVVRAMLDAGWAVRALIRDADSAPARALAAQGVSLVTGSFEDAAALDAAMVDVDTVFSVQPAPYADPDSERRQARALVDAASRAGVRHLIHSSVSNAGDFRTMAGWAEGRWSRNYWESKADVEAIVRTGGFAHATILRPAFMMDNFALPKAQWMFPDLAQGEILTAVEPETSIALIAARDLGVAVAAAAADPARFGGELLELAGDSLTLPGVAAVLARVKGGPVVARTLDAETLVARGQHGGWVETQQWMNVVGYPARPEVMAAAGLAPTSFADWARDMAVDRCRRMTVVERAPC